MSNQDLRVKSEDQLPEGWRLVSLRDIIVEAQPGFACGTRSPDGVIQLRMNNINTRGNFVWDEFIRVPVDSEIIKKYEITEGDILFNNTNSVELVGKSAIFHGYHEPVVYSNHFTRIRVEKSCNDPSYLARWLVLQRHLGIFAALCNRWVGQSALKNDQLFTLSIPLPPTLEEQKRIAEILSEQMAAVEKARAAAGARLEAAMALPSAYLRKVLPQPGQELPNGWQWSQLGDVCEFLDSQRVPVNNEERQKRIAGKSSSSLYPYYGANGQVGWIDDYIFDEPLILLAEDGGFFGSREHPIAYKISGKSWVNNHAHVLRPKDGHDFDFCLHTLTIRPDVGLMVTGNTRPKLNQEIAAKIPIPLPSPVEQKRIAAMLNRQMEAVGNIFQTIHQELEAINALPGSLLRKAFSGGL